MAGTPDSRAVDEERDMPEGRLYQLGYICDDIEEGIASSMAGA
jgi:hypothetical protein